MPNNRRKVEVFSAGCGVCDETIALVQKLSLRIMRCCGLRHAQAGSCSKSRALWCARCCRKRQSRRVLCRHMAQ